MSSALIVNFQSSALCARAVSTLQKEGIEHILVLDNASDSDQVAMLRSFQQELGFELEFSPENLGFGAGINRAFQLLNPSDEEIVHIVNPDLTVDSGCIEVLENAIDHYELDIVSPVVWKSTKPRNLWHAGGMIDWNRGRTQHLRTLPPDKDFLECDFLPGAHLALRARTFRELGGFDESFFLYWEDTDFSIRAQEKGFRLGCVASAHSTHIVGGSQGVERGKSPTFFYFMQKNRLKFFSCSRREWKILLGNGAPYTLGLLMWPLIQPKQKIRGFLAGIRGIRDGLAEVRGAKTD